MRGLRNPGRGCNSGENVRLMEDLNELNPRPGLLELDIVVPVAACRSSGFDVCQNESLRAFTSATIEASPFQAQRDLNLPWTKSCAGVVGI